MLWVKTVLSMCYLDLKRACLQVFVHIFQTYPPGKNLSCKSEIGSLIACQNADDLVGCFLQALMHPKRLCEKA